MTSTHPLEPVTPEVREGGRARGRIRWHELGWQPESLSVTIRPLPILFLPDQGCVKWEHGPTGLIHAPHAVMITVMLGKVL